MLIKESVLRTMVEGIVRETLIKEENGGGGNKTIKDYFPNATDIFGSAWILERPKYKAISIHFEPLDDEAYNILETIGENGYQELRQFIETNEIKLLDKLNANGGNFEYIDEITPRQSIWGE